MALKLDEPEFRVADPAKGSFRMEVTQCEEKDHVFDHIFAQHFRQRFEFTAGKDGEITIHVKQWRSSGTLPAAIQAIKRLMAEAGFVEQ